MKIRLYSIEQAPATVPPWHAILADLCHPPAHRVAKVLGTSSRTIKRYNASGNAPRMACLALFWLTSWGRSAVDAQATNDARVAVGLMQCLQDRVIELEAAVQHLQAIGEFGAANDPCPQPRIRGGRHALPR